MSEGRLGALLRLVFITPGRRDASAAQILTLIEQVLEGGATAILLREPQLGLADREALYSPAVKAIHAAGALALVSKDVGLAVACGADGVQLGYGSPSVEEARARAPGLLVGRSCHWPPVQDDWLADYLMLSPFRPTHRSLDRPLLTTEQVQSVVTHPGLGPVVALGGLTAADVSDLPDGLAGMAVIRSLSEARDPRGAAAVLRSQADARWSFGGSQGGATDGLF